MSIYKTFETDKNIEQEGIEVDYGDTRFVLARAGGANNRFKKVFQAKTKPYRRQIETDTLSESVARKMLAEAYAEAIIIRVDVAEVDDNNEPILVKGEKKWKLNRIPLEDGTDSPATQERVTALLLDLPELFADIQEMATLASNYRAVEEEADSGN